MWFKIWDNHGIRWFEIGFYMGLRGMGYISIYLPGSPKRLSLYQDQSLKCWIALRKFKHGLQEKKPSALW